jgi:class 3 adenylate cyclase
MTGYNQPHWLFRVATPSAITADGEHRHQSKDYLRYEGTVNQVLGDEIMALFGAPIAHEDHAVRTGYAALKMQEAIASYAGQFQQQYGISLQIRVELNAGEVVVRGIDNDLAMD